MKESVAYQAVASNTSGSTPKDLFEDVVEELENQVEMFHCSKPLICKQPVKWLFMLVSFIVITL